MPDLITHVAISHLVRRPYELTRRNRDMMPFRSLFYLGTILPDILTRPFYILFPATYNWTFPFHTFLGIVLTILLISQFFDTSIRKRAFLNLTGGMGLHFLADGLQVQLHGNNFWLFPFSWKNFSYGIATAGQMIEYIPFWIIGIILFEVIIYWIQKSRQAA